jgi:hypothetical protein
MCGIRTRLHEVDLVIDYGEVTRTGPTLPFMESGIFPQTSHPAAFIPDLHFPHISKFMKLDVMNIFCYIHCTQWRSQAPGYTGHSLGRGRESPCLLFSVVA